MKTLIFVTVVGVGGWFGTHSLTLRLAISGAVMMVIGLMLAKSKALDLPPYPKAETVTNVSWPDGSCVGKVRVYRRLKPGDLLRGGGLLYRVTSVSYHGYEGSATVEIPPDS